MPRSAADPEDVVHTALLAVLAHREPISHLRAYLYQVMDHEMDKAAKRHARVRGYASLDADVRLEEEPVTDVLAQVLVRHAVKEALEGLPLQQRRVVLLQRELGMSHQEAARVLGSAPATVGVHAHRAVLRLRQTLVGVSAVLAGWPLRARCSQRGRPSPAPAAAGRWRAGRGECGP
ncbi:sigma-70 family RNA polymerase sigma factor [Streptomyces sp. NPDC051214]|uniref:RNA polymerase sigma factor n=1 Tax=Streptomyces sp. NPDC051214 TaxID=3155282 RepID=UPI003425E416